MRSALLKRMPWDGGSACGMKAAVAIVGKVNDASARHSSQELQLHDAAVSPDGPPSTEFSAWFRALMGQSSGMAVEVAKAASLPDSSVLSLAELCVITTCCIAMSTAMASPIQPRMGSKAIMKATSRRRMAGGYDK